MAVHLGGRLATESKQIFRPEGQCQCYCLDSIGDGYWVNLSKRGGKDRDFQADRTAPRDFPWAKPKGNPEEQPCQPKKTPSFPTLLLRFTFYFQQGFSK